MGGEEERVTKNKNEHQSKTTQPKFGMPNGKWVKNTELSEIGLEEGAKA